MQSYLLKYWDRIRSGFWFVPGMMTSAAVALAWVAVTLDQRITARSWIVRQSWIYSGGAEGASQVLSTIAGSMVTITGVVFSMTLVALSLASSQLGPRLLRNFMRDTRNQVVLGTFIATFVYSLLVLRTIRRGAEELFVPHFALTVAVLLVIVSLAVLIYFIHHVSVSIQADEVAARVHAELVEGIDRLFPQGIDEGAPSKEEANPIAGLPLVFDLEARSVLSAEDGYVQSIDMESLLALARDGNALLRLERRPGQYVVMGTPLAMVWPGNLVSKPLEERINSAFILGDQRTALHDIEFPVTQLVEIAVRALSPGVNDPFTAMTCIDRLGSALHRLARREMPSASGLDELGQLRVVVSAITFPEIVDASLGPIRQYARTSVGVAVRLLQAIAVVGSAATRSTDRAALLHQAEMIARGAHEALPEEGDRLTVERSYRDATRSLANDGSGAS